MYKNEIYPIMISKYWVSQKVCSSFLNTYGKPEWTFLPTQYPAWHGGVFWKLMLEYLFEVR